MNLKSCRKSNKGWINGQLVRALAVPTGASLTGVCNSSSRGSHTLWPSGALSTDTVHIHAGKMLLHRRFKNFKSLKKISKKQSVLCILGGSLKNQIKMLSWGLIAIRCYYVDNESCEAFYSNKKTGNLNVFKIFLSLYSYFCEYHNLKIDRGCQDGSVSIICRANWTILSSSFRTHRQVKGEN